MALQTSGPISANDINIELGRSGTASFSLNGADERGLAGVASGLIDFQDFYGKSSISASLDSPRTVGHVVLDPANATCYYRVGSSGELYGGGSTSAFIEVWRDEGSNPDFQVRATKVSGTTPTGTFGSWLNPGDNPTWALGRSTIGSNQTVMDIEIRDASTLAVLTTSRVTMNAEVLAPF